MNFIEEFTNRGYLYQCTDLQKLTAISNSKQIVAYIGFDCTAQSLHVGNLMQIMVLRLLQQCGHKPLILIGSTTTTIGDPTGRDTVRKILTPEEIAKNIQGIKYSLEKFIKFGDGDNDALMVDNSHWLEGIGYLEFLKSFGRYISVNHMLTLDSIKTRLEREQSLTFLELNYPLLQAYDFYTLRQKYDCVLQIGGSDQWGNIIMGVELCRKLGIKDIYGLTTPLLTTSDGKKMGKTANGAIWLNEDMLSPYEFFQYWRNSTDNDLLRFAKLYCEFKGTEFDNFKNEASININNAKKNLAFKITSICHGSNEATDALNTSVQIFEQNALDDNMPTLLIENAKITAENIHIVDLVCLANLNCSKSEARRLIKGGGIKINDEKIIDENYLIKLTEFAKNAFKLSLSKKKHILVLFNQ